MATYGSYEAVKELYRGKLVTTFDAKKVVEGDPGDRFVIHVFSPSLGQLSSDTLQQESKLFLEAAEVQQKTVEKGAQHWVPIHEFGDSSDGAYYVADHYDRTVRRLVVGQVRLDGHTLHIIVSDIIQGLIELRDACGRPHGELRPDNLYLDENQKGLITKALMANPSPMSRVDMTEGYLEDLRGIGEIIHELVLHKPLSALGGWPVPDGAEWSALGRKAGAWRELCNLLLDPDLAEQCPTLDELAENQLPALAQPRTSRRPILAVGAGSLAVLAALIIAWVVWPREKPPVPFPQEKWSKLCIAYDNWVGPLYYFGYVKEQLDGWNEDQHLKVVTDNLQISDIIEQIDPGKIGGFGGPRSIQAANPPMQVIAEPGPEKTERAYAIVISMESAMTDWPPLQVMRDTQQLHAQMEWEISADYLKSLVESARLKWPKKGEKREDFIVVYNRLLRNHQSLTELFQTGEDPQQSKDQFTRQFFRVSVIHLQSRAASKAKPDGNRFANSLRDLLDLKKYVETCGSDRFDIQDQIGHFKQDFGDDELLDSFQQDLSRYENNLRSALNLIEKDVEPDQVTKAAKRVQDKLVALKGQVDGFLSTQPQVVDPRSIPDDLAQVGEIREHLDQLLAYQDQENRDEIGDRLANLLGQMDGLYKLPWIRKHQKEIESAWGDMAVDLNGISQQAGKRIAYLAKPLAEPDPRRGLTNRANRLYEDSRRLTPFDKGSSDEFAQDIEAIQVRLEDSFQEYTQWIRAYEIQIVALSENVDGELAAIDRKLFPLLDPRKYWSWKEEASYMRQELLASEVSPKVRDQFQTIQGELEDFYTAAWTAESRSSVEQRYQDFRSRMDELADQIITDPRKLFRRKWDQLAVHIEAVLRFRQVELQDPQQATLDSDFRTIETRKNAVDQRSWPEDNQGRSVIRKEVQALSQAVNAFYVKTDPRPFWRSQSKRRVKEIEEGLRQLRAKSDPSEGQYRSQLKNLMAMRSAESWSPESQQGIAEDIKQNKRSLEQLNQSIYTKLDPRLQIAWSQVATDLNDEIGRLANNDRTTARQLKGQLEAILADVEQLNQSPFDPQRKAEIERSVVDLESRLLSVYVSAIFYSQQIEGIASATLDRAWAKRRQELIKSQPRVGGLQSDVDELRKFLRDCFDQLSTVLAIESHPRNWRVDVANHAVFAAREDLLAKVFGPWLEEKAAWNDVTNVDRWSDVEAEFDRWRSDVAAMMEDFAAIERAFESAYSLDEVPRGYRQSVEELYSQWKQRTDLFGRFQSAIPSVVDVIVNLQEIATLDRPDQLIVWANRGQADLDPAITFAAWRSLANAHGGSWPADLSQLKQEQDLRLWLGAIIRDSIDDSARQSMLEEELRQQGHLRWVRCFAQLNDPKALEEAMGLSGEFDVDISQLQPVVQFDFRLFAFKQAIQELPHDATSLQVRKKVEEFQQDLTQLPGGVATSDKVQAFLEKMGQLLTAKDEDRDQEPDLAKAGPEASPIWDELSWKRQESEDRKRVVYTWKPRKGTAHTIEFVRTEAGSFTNKSFYMSTTEVSFGLFGDLFKMTDKWEHFKALNGDPVWRGPKVWRWRKGKLRTNKHKGRPIWTPPDTLLKSGGGQIPDYATSIKPSGPDDGYPMQYVSPEAAIYFARLLGCRLPTAGEWKAAIDAETSGVDLQQYISDQRPNLRDGTWSQQSQHAEAFVKQGVRISRPSAGSFGALDSDTQVYPYDDGLLWFDLSLPSQAVAGRLYHHLVGNVAEYVVQTPDQLDTLEVSELDPSETSDIMRAVTRSNQISVIGGSALSSPTINADQPQLINQESTTPLAYSDVGFRLTFSAPRQSLKAQLYRYLDDQGYAAAGTLGATTAP